MSDEDPLSYITPPDTGSALGKGVLVLAAILNAETPPSLNDLARATKLPRQTVFRVVRQLEDTLLVTRAAAGDRYVVGPNLMSLATSALTSFAHGAPVRTILNGLVSDVGETCNVGVVDRDGIVYVERVECQWPLRLQITVGSRAPLHATAIGKLLLAHLPARTRKRLVNGAPLHRYTENTITDTKALDVQFRQIRRQGYATNNQENMIGMMGIAVPIFDARGRAVAGLSLHAPAARLSIQGAIDKLDRIRHAAKQIESAMRAQLQSEQTGSLSA